MAPYGLSSARPHGGPSPRTRAAPRLRPSRLRRTPRACDRPHTKAPPRRARDLRGRRVSISGSIAGADKQGLRCKQRRCCAVNAEEFQHGRSITNRNFKTARPPLGWRARAWTMESASWTERSRLKGTDLGRAVRQCSRPKTSCGASLACPRSAAATIPAATGCSDPACANAGSTAPAPAPGESCGPEAAAGRA